jgi:ferredoxin
MSIGTNGMQATVNDEMNDLTEKCFKCKGSCRSRAVLCINKHWVHFICEKFTKLEIEQIEQNENEPYTCSQCKTKEVRKIRCTPNKIEEQQQTDSQITKYQHKHSEEIMSPTLAQLSLQEELMNTCLVCSNILTSYTTLCMVCSQSYHLGCVDISKETCYACLGSQHQFDQHNNITEETALPIVRRETTATINEIPQTRTQRQQERQIQLKLKI